LSCNSIDNLVKLVTIKFKQFEFLKIENLQIII